MEAIETEGESVEAAAATAAAALGLDRSQLAIEVLQQPSRGFLGLGARKARIRATRIPVPPVHAVHAVQAVHDAVHAVHDAAHAAEVLQAIVDRMGVTARVTAADDGDHVALAIDGDASGFLIGRHGQMLDALEHLVGRIVARDEQHAVHLVVDANGYRERRRRSLEETARHMAAEARRRRRTVTLDAMSARDRRTVHLALQDEPGITTRSSGDGLLRQVLIVPVNAPRRPRPARD